MPKFAMTKQKFVNQWLRHFASSIDKRDIESCVTDQYIWHIFSCELLNKDSFLEGDDARRAYNEADKSNCIFCDMFGPYGVSDTEKEEYSSSEKIDRSITELYVVSKDYSWTYIKTHESGLCGPYFMKK